MITTTRLRALLPACAALLSACAAFPPNPPLSQYDPQSGYRFETLSHDANSDELFVVVTLSGGGTRAAALSYGVLAALRDTRIEWRNRSVSLLDEVDVISSISGGSFTAAYYALYGERLFAEFPEKFLYRPIQSELMTQAFLPTNAVRLAGPSFGRSDLAAEFYDREVFGGGTYADVIQRNRRPFVVLNATDMSTGAQFPFIQDQFDLLCSDLAGVPLARAAAASSAFPGGLTPLTFRNHAGSCGYRQPSWVEPALEDHTSRRNVARTAAAEQRVSYTAAGAARRDYIHLTDGGVADNIGLRGPLRALSTVDHPWSLMRMIDNEQIGTLLVIVVNAATEPATDRDRTAAVPGLVDTLTTAATVPLDNYSFDTLALLTAAVTEYTATPRVVDDCRKAAARKGPQCELTLPDLYRIDMYPVQVAFEYVGDDDERDWFKNLPTTLELPRDTVDRLCDVGRRLLQEDPNFQKVLREFNGSVRDAGAGC